MSAFADLGNPTELNFSAYDRGYCFVIRGGGGARRAYEAQFFVEDDVVRRRRVNLTAYAKDTWEETTYGWPGRMKP
jgi:hypothetical protein